MPSLLERFAKTWGDTGRDVVLIVGSILIAFGLDAWWDGLGERRAQSEQIASLRSEFITARRTLGSVAAGLELSGQATNGLLALMGPQAPSADPDTVVIMLQRSFNVGISVPSHTALDGVLAAGISQVMAKDSLVGMLERWPGLMEDLAVDSEHLERNRDVDLQAALVDIGIPGIAVAASASPLGLPPSAFPMDTDRMVRSVRVYAGLYYRAFRFSVVSEYLRTVLGIADAIVEQLDELSGMDAF